MAINTNMAAIFSITFTGSCITIFINIVIISLILRKRQLWKTRFYIIANLAVSDIITLFTLVSIVLTRVLTGPFKEITMFIIISKVICLTSRITSLLTLVFLAVDRYIAVRYSLRYQMILTKKKTCFVLAAVWLFSFSISGMTWIKVSGYYKHKRNILITLAVFRVTTSALLLTLSKYTNTIRKKHINSIEKRTKYFGVTKEKLGILKALKKSLEDSFKLYIATVFVQIAATIASVTNMLLSKNRYGFQVIMILLLQMIDVIVLAISQSDIRKALQRLFKKNRVEPLHK